MKIIDVPQTGKLGLTVTYPGRSGLIRRSWVVPANPRTGDQLLVRTRLAQYAAGYDALTEAQQDAWITAAAQYQTKPSLGQSGPMTGLQLFVRINTNLAAVGEPAVATPPDRPQFDTNVATALELTNHGDGKDVLFNALPNVFDLLHELGQRQFLGAIAQPLQSVRKLIRQLPIVLNGGRR